jgi:antitoxin component YwqK of YwqJK toxin-antitoxin module
MKLFISLSFVLFLLIGHSQTIKINSFSGECKIEHREDIKAKVELMADGKYSFVISALPYQTLLQTKFNKRHVVSDSLILFNEFSCQILLASFKDTILAAYEEINTPYRQFRFGGILHGTTSYWEKYENCTKAIQTPLEIKNYHNGKKEGKQTQFFPKTGLPRIISNYSEGLLHGEFIEYNADGTFLSKGNYKNGKNHGTFTYYHENNKPASEENYSEGNLEGQSKGWHENGNVAYRHNYTNGLLHGFYYSYFENGKIKDSLFYENDLLHGKQVSYHPNEKKAGECTYEKGNVISDELTWNENGILIYKKIIPDKNGFTIESQWNDKGVLTETVKENPSLLYYERITYFENGKKECREFTGLENKNSTIYSHISECWDKTGKRISHASEPVKLSDQIIEYIDEEVEINEQEIIPEPYFWKDPEIKWKHPATPEMSKELSKLKNVKFIIQIAENSTYSILLHPEFKKNKKTAKLIPELENSLIVTPFVIGKNVFNTTVTISFE